MWRVKRREAHRDAWRVVGGAEERWGAAVEGRTERRERGHEAAATTVLARLATKRPEA